MGRLHPRLVLERAGELLLRLLRGETGDALELGALRLDQLGELALAGLDLLLALGDRLFARADLALALGLLGEPLVEVVLLLGQPALQRLELVAALARGLLELVARRQQLLLGRQLGLAQLGLLLALRLFENLRRLAPRLGDAPTRRAADPQQPDGDQRERRGDDRTYENGCFHLGPPERRKQAGSGTLPSEREERSAPPVKPCGPDR